MFNKTNTAVLAALAAAALAPATLAQTVSVAVQGPESVAPGETIQLTVVAEVTGLPAAGAFGGFGLDLDAIGAAAAFSDANIEPLFDLGQLAGTPGSNVLERVVAGQLINVFDLNSDVDQSTTLTLFTADMTIDDDAELGSEVTVVASAAANGGIVLYEDATSGTSLRLPGAAGTTLEFVQLTIDVVGGCSGDTNGDNEVNTGDLLTLLASFGNPTTNGAADGDFDGSGEVNTGDLLALLAAFGTNC